MIFRSAIPHTLAAAVLFAGGFAFSAPRLSQNAETVADGELRAKVLAQATGVPAPSLKSQGYVVRRGADERRVKFYRPVDVWRRRAFAGEWKDRRGNVMRLARVKSLVPAFDREDWYLEEIEKRLDELERAFSEPTEAQLAEWRAAWGDDGVGTFFTARNGRRYFVSFAFAERVPPKDAERLLKDFTRSVSDTVLKGAPTSMKWWETTNARWSFLTDMDKAKGGKFVADTMRLADAMRRAYQYYVPAEKPVPVCRVRVFRTLAGYREYRASTGARDDSSCGLWDPSREELLVSAENRESALETMRHEAFHQYLHYATGRGDHASWFNEGHATFFENVKYNPAKNDVQVVDTGGRADWTARNPAAVAGLLPRVVRASRDEFYAGGNAHYVAAWALVYFLEKGAYASNEFEPYRRVVPDYLAAMARGVSAEEATRTAFAPVANRDLAADFLLFWNKLRKRALNAR